VYARRVMRRSRGLALLPGWVAAILAVGSTALAQDAGAHAAAVARFEEGTRLVEQGDCTAAIPKFVDSLKSEEGVGAHLNLADCYARIGSPERAWMEFKAAERFATLKRNDERREVAHNGAYALERKLLRLTLTLPYAEGLEVRINGMPIEGDLLASRLVAIAPGKFKIVATAKNKKPATKEGSGAAGEVQAVSLTLEDDAPPKAPAGPPAVLVPASSTQRTAGIVVGAVGLGAVAVGSIFGIVALNRKSELESAFESNASCRGSYASGSCTSAAHEQLDGLESSASSAATLSTVFMIVGGVAVATGATLFFLAPSSSSRGALRVMPQVTATSRALVLGATW
jgi:hypothetical protein